MPPSLWSKGVFYIYELQQGVCEHQTDCGQILTVALKLPETRCILGRVTDKLTQREANRAAAAGGKRTMAWMTGGHLSGAAGCTRMRWTGRQEMIFISGRGSKMVETGVSVDHNTVLMAKYRAVWNLISDYIRSVRALHTFVCIYKEGWLFFVWLLHITWLCLLSTYFTPNPSLLKVLVKDTNDCRDKGLQNRAFYCLEATMSWF